MPNPILIKNVPLASHWFPVGTPWELEFINHNPDKILSVICGNNLSKYILIIYDFAKNRRNPHLCIKCYYQAIQLEIKLLIWFKSWGPNYWTIYTTNRRASTKAAHGHYLLATLIDKCLFICLMLFSNGQFVPFSQWRTVDSSISNKIASCLSVSPFIYL